MEIQFQHHHVLTFCDQNKENFSHILLNERKRRKADGDLEFADLDYPECCVCCTIVDDGPVYFCEKCDDIWVHKFCASLPREIRAHPLHLQQDHSLTLQTIRYFRFYRGGYTCDCCGGLIKIPNYYECSECGLNLDCKCALSPDNDHLQQITLLLSPDTKTQISHGSHPHTLFLVNSRSRKKWTTWTCSLCEMEIVDLAYCCTHCRFYLHKRCVEITQQECEVQLPCHWHHPVSIQYHRENFICDRCRDLYRCTFMAICKKCDFKFDFKCAFLKDVTIQRLTEDEEKTQIRYFNHDLHWLSFFNCTSDINLECKGCRLPLLGPSYGCLECSVYLHKSCAELPRIIQHPYHPFHNLDLIEHADKPFHNLDLIEHPDKRFHNLDLIEHPDQPLLKFDIPALVKGLCRACRRFSRGLIYRCSWCPYFRLDTQCAINNLEVISALKNKEYHQHDLYYFVHPDRTNFQCNICSEKWGGSFYICIECDSYFHVKCIGIPKKVKHDSHIHPLTLMDPLTKYDIDKSKVQYYCYTCENKRNPRYHAYSCQQCANTGHIFTAHIECVLSTELNEIEHNHKMEEDDEEVDLDKLSISPRCMKQLLLKDKYKDHILNCIQDIPGFYCYLCDDESKGTPCYKCSLCLIYLHKECAELPFKINQNLHEHPLFIQGGEFLKRFICDECKVYHERDMCYQCEECNFFLDRTCALNLYPKLNDNRSKDRLSHFSHKHELRFAFIHEKLEVDCSACQLLISGPTYCCYACSFFLHESCFDELKPQYIQHPFHIQHPLHFKAKLVFCKACTNYSDIGYECAEGDFGLDIKCVKYLTSGLQHKCHEHKLFCFVAEDIEGIFCLCKHCHKKCNAFFNRCLDCYVNLHIECMSIPKSVKSECHVHPLTLMDSINEEGQAEYYCHACEELRNPKHAAYSCKTCYYTAHIGCVLDEEEGEIEIL